MTLLAITGTPGTGKTTIAKLLHKKIKNSRIISIKSLAKKCSCGYDKKRGCWIVDEKKLRKEIKSITTQHLSSDVRAGPYDVHYKYNR